MGATAFAFRMMGMVTIVLATAAGHFAVPALRIVGRRFVDAKWRLGVFMRSARAALPDAGWRLR